MAPEIVRHRFTVADYEQVIAVGIPGVWMVDLAAMVLERHTEPGPQGYRVATHARRGEALDSTTLPGLNIALDDVVE